MPNDEVVGFTVGDVARFLGVSISTVRRFTDEGKLTCERTRSGHRRYEPDAVRAFAEAKGRPS